MIVHSPSLSSHETFVQRLCGCNIYHMIQLPKLIKKGHPVGVKSCYHRPLSVSHFHHRHWRRSRHCLSSW